MFLPGRNSTRNSRTRLPRSFNKTPWRMSVRNKRGGTLRVCRGGAPSAHTCPSPYACRFWWRGRRRVAWRAVLCRTFARGHSQLTETNPRSCMHKVLSRLKFMKMHLIFHSLNVLGQTRRGEFVKSADFLANPIPRSCGSDCRLTTSSRITGEQQ